jgi:hypothetical protein
MLPRITQAQYISDFTIRLRFADGLEGDIDLSQELHGEIFRPLRDLTYFRRFQLHPELHTLVWPNGADFAPEFLRKKLTIAA